MVYRLKSRKRDDIDLVWITVYVVSAMYQEFIVDGVEAEKKIPFLFLIGFFIRDIHLIFLSLIQ